MQADTQPTFTDLEIPGGNGKLLVDANPRRRFRRGAGFVDRSGFRITFARGGRGHRGGGGGGRGHRGGSGGLFSLARLAFFVPVQGGEDNTGLYVTSVPAAAVSAAAIIVAIIASRRTTTPINTGCWRI